MKSHDATKRDAATTNNEGKTTPVPTTRNTSTNNADNQYQLRQIRTPIQAQAFQTARNILAKGKHDNKPILEEACRRLLEAQSTSAARPVTYNQVKHMMTAVRADNNSRPTTAQLAPRQRRQPVDTARFDPGARGGLVGGASQFSLAHLTNTDAVKAGDH